MITFINLLNHKILNNRINTEDNVIEIRNTNDNASISINNKITDSYLDIELFHGNNRISISSANDVYTDETQDMPDFYFFNDYYLNEDIDKFIKDLNFVLDNLGMYER